MSAEIAREMSQHVSKREAQAAARARVTADRRLDRKTPKWIVDLAESGQGMNVRVHDADGTMEIKSGKSGGSTEISSGRSGKRWFLKD